MKDPALSRLIPPLYSGHYRYKPEPRDRNGWRENWQSALENAQLKSGDCEDLVAQRVAEYWMRGIPAMPDVKTVNPLLKHVRVRMPDGTIEDPSKRLGMK